MVFKVACALSLLAILTDIVNGHAYSSQHVYRHDGPPHPAYIHKHGHGHDHDHGHKHKHAKHADYYSQPHYEIEYKVVDHVHTGNNIKKNHHKLPIMDGVKGYFEIRDSDGSIKYIPDHGERPTRYPVNVKHGDHHTIPNKKQPHQPHHMMTIHHHHHHHHHHD